MRQIDKIVVLNCIQREEEGKVLKKIIENSTDINVGISLDRGFDLFQNETIWMNYKQALKMSTGKGRFRLVVHDDIGFMRNAFKKMEYILKFFPDNCFVTFFNPKNKGHLEAIERGKRVLKTQTNFWMPAMCTPVHLINEFLEFGDKYKDYSDNARITLFCKEKDIPVYAILPSLVQHFGPYRSTLGNAGKIGGKTIRYSPLYSPEMDEKIDWKFEIDNAHLNESNVNLSAVRRRVKR